MRKMLVIMSIVASFIGIVLIYEYPIQRAVAMNKFYKYIKLQGASKENIVDMKVHKNYKMGGYNIVLKYKDDSPDNRYVYHYEPIYFFKNEIRGNYISLHVNIRRIKGDNEGNKRREEKVKYKPLE